MDAVHLMNKYLLSTDVGTMLGYDGVGLMPIFPVQATPEANAINPEFPFMTYSVRSTNKQDMWWIMIDEVTYVIQSQDYDDLSDVSNEIIDICRRLDESAIDVNKYLYDNNLNDYYYYYVKFVSSLDPEPASEEGGRYLKPLTIRYEYSPKAARGVV